MRRLKITIEGIVPKDGDIIVAKCEDPEAVLFRARELHGALKNVFPNNKVVVLPSDFRLKQIDKEQFWTFIKSLEALRPEGEREEINM